MNYTITGTITAHKQATFSSKKINVPFGIKSDQIELPNPFELLLGSFAACCLKNIERFSNTLKFNYESAQIDVTGERQEKPAKIRTIKYMIRIRTNDPKLNLDLLHKNLQNFGTIYNTLKENCEVSGEIQFIKP